MHFPSYQLYPATESSSQHYQEASVENLSIVLSVQEFLPEVAAADYSIAIAYH